MWIPPRPTAAPSFTFPRMMTIHRYFPLAPMRYAHLLALSRAHRIRKVTPPVSIATAA